MANVENIEERPKPIIIHDTEKNHDYTLEFNRDAVKFAEQRGFSIEDVDRYQMTKVPEFFWYAFRWHHPSVSMQQAEDILYRMGGMTEALGQRLGELWAVPYKALSNTGDEKNVTVTVEL